ncbi:MAG: Zn-dependent hydrolase [Candidatus Methylomirabilota bacterium]
MVPTIDGDRLWADLMALGEIGYAEGRGVTRTALSEADLAGKAWLIRRFEESGLAVRTDAAFNILGRLSCGKKGAPLVAVGSHLDTVPQGGKFDGMLGVLGGLECARTLREQRVALPWDLEIISFTDEEGAHGTGTVGSRAMLGLLKDGELTRHVGKGRATFAEDLARAGKDPARIDEARRDATEFAGYLELHIEQGRRLESEGIRIGAVTAIVGIFRYLVTVTGEASHAGATPMALRDDALVKAAPLFTLLPEWVRERNPEMVGTIGQLELQPGAANVVPGACRFMVEIRSQHRADMVQVRERLRAYAAGRNGWEVETVVEKEGTPCAPRLIQAVADAAAAAGLSCIRMPSGAGHDAQSFAAAGVPTGMIFIPCRRGMSHSPEEWIEPAQAAQGCQVLLRTLLGQAEAA